MLAIIIIIVLILCVGRWVSGGKDIVGFYFLVLAAGAIAFLIVLFLPNPLKQPGTQSHNPATIVDGPAYLASKKKPTAEPDGGNGLVVDSAAPAISPNAVARGLSVVPGAIVCADLQTVSTMFDWYAEYWGEQMQDAETNGQSRLIRSDIPAPVMPPGCALLPAGTPVEAKLVNGIPVVYAKLGDGSTIKGVTLGGMVSGNSGTGNSGTDRKFTSKYGVRSARLSKLPVRKM